MGMPIMIQMIKLEIINVMLEQTDQLLHIQVNFQDDAEDDDTYVHPVGITIFPTNRGGNPMPEVTGYLDDVEQLDVDTIQVAPSSFCLHRRNIYFHADTIQNEEDSIWEVEKEYTLIPSRSLDSLLCSQITLQVVQIIGNTHNSHHPSGNMNLNIVMIRK